MHLSSGAGKSTYIKEHGLERYTLSPDNLRLLCTSPNLMPDGSFTISQEPDSEAATWKILMELLEYRMSRGEFTVVDATCSKTSDMNRYKKLADLYRYRIYCIDFSTVPLEVCLRQNKMRESIKWVPEEAIRNIYARFATQKVPGGIKIIKPDELDLLLDIPVDLSCYNKLVFIGDIHGSYDTLMQYDDFKKGLNETTGYIFLGDYIDRGTQNTEVLKFLADIKDLPNVCLLEGNHEQYLRAYGEGLPVKSSKFTYSTKPELLSGGFTPKDARMLSRKFRQFSHILFNSLDILACHGGIPNLNTNLLYIPASKFIKGVGTYEDAGKVAEAWMFQTESNQYLLHGHRNVDNVGTRSLDRVFNLEGHIDNGGAIRIVELVMQDGKPSWSTIELESIQPVKPTVVLEKQPIFDIDKAVLYLRTNKYVNENKLTADVSSFNFSSEAFWSKYWDEQTILARGLFIDTTNNKIMARSYEKFFRIDEQPSTERNTLRNSLCFPLTAYIKENGFLGIVAYDYLQDDLFIASKSTIDGPYADYLKQILEPYKLKLLEKLKGYYEAGNPKSFVFECIDVVNDPHIIEYESSKVVLLDIIDNTLKFKKIDYESLKKEADDIGCAVKKKAFVLQDWYEFIELYDSTQLYGYTYEDKPIEGFVFEDSSGFMFKVKTDFYNFWKAMRLVAQKTLRSGYLPRTGSLQKAEANLFYGYCKSLYEEYEAVYRETKAYPIKTDIISLRKAFLADEKAKNLLNTLC